MIEKKQRTRWGISALSIGSLLIGWYLVTDVFGFVSNVVLPSPLSVLQGIFEYRSLILKNLEPTVVASAVGFVWATVLAFLMAVVLTYSKRAERLLLPLIVSGNSIPRVALAPLIIFYVSGFDAKYMLSAWIAFFPLLVNIHEGLTRIDEDQMLLLRSFDATAWQGFKWVRFPNALAFIFDGMKIGVILSIVGAVVGEFVASDEGMGNLALVALEAYETDLVFGIVGIMGLLSVSAFFVLFSLQDRVIHWHQTNLFTE
ncbi:ABC transporter permease [Halocatena salina]|uniref:ABC transporter permease n=1 Tax=Halocatena salina TaxID=2934340 RepID=A0A8U0A554_9EURY|nr:ABC transporter permease [Halocatena salina]UPM44340.1 ABC transporter permease [Halocatena salina]